MARKPKSLDEWRKALNSLDDDSDDESSKLRDRVEIGSKVSSSISDVAARGDAIPPREAEALTTELQKTVSSLSIEEAKEALKQAQSKMDLALKIDPNLKQSHPVIHKKKKNKLQKQNPSSSSSSSNNSELTKIQLEMKEMMDALKKVSSAANEARKEAEIKAKNVEKIRMEVNEAERKTDEEKAKMDESFKQMSSSLQQEALKHKDELLADINTESSSLSSQINKNKFVELELSPERNQSIDFTVSGKVMTNYRFRLPNGSEEDEANNVALDGDYIAAYVPPKKAREHHSDDTDSILLPKDLSNYLDFNYIDEGSIDWERHGVVEVTVSAKYRSQELLMCYVSGEQCLASILISPSSSPPPTTSSLSTPFSSSSSIQPSSLPDEQIGYKPSSQIVLENLNSICCYRLSVPVHWTETLRSFVQSISDKSLTTNGNAKEEESICYPELGFRASSQLVSFAYPLIPSSTSASHLFELNLGDVHQSLVLKSLSFHINDQSLDVRIPYQRVKKPIQKQKTKGSKDTEAISLSKHELLISTRKQARVARSKASRRAFLLEQKALAEGLPMPPHEQKEVVDEKKVEEPEESSSLDPGSFTCAFCDHVIVSRVTRCGPAPVGLLDNICDDLMCSACPVIDLSCEGVMPLERQCLYSNQAFLFRSSDVLPSTITSHVSTKLDPEEEDSRAIVKCARCCVPLGDIIPASYDDSPSSGVRLYRHRVCCEKLPAMGNPQHQPDTYLSSYLISLAKKSNQFQFTIHNTGSESLKINVKLLSWSGLFCSLDVSEPQNKSSSDSNDQEAVQLIQEMNQILKMEYVINGEHSTGNTPKNLSDVFLEDDEFDFVRACLIDNCGAFKSAAIQSGMTSSISCLKLASDFE